ncbi:hypothetical protein B5807_10340 [Epicoccum nigrum]|uniref:Uncharacterized protein n=1 Tax=Epicoccum nigrum TaxID=105696 RepID=A0A1Y2LQH9_EPING|nr:hypothetical protein B5807_10340 [Epicoccum nigrum]
MAGHTHTAQVRRRPSEEALEGGSTPKATIKHAVATTTTNAASVAAAADIAHAGNLNLKPGQRPAFAIQRTDKNEKFPYGQDNKVNAKEVGTLAEDFLALG